MPTDPIYNVLFLCTGNSARSIMGEVLLNRLGQGRFRGFSAGSHPKGDVHPLALRVLAEAGYATEGLRSKSWEGLSAERLFGNYWAVAIERTSDGFRSAFYTLTADGAGTCWLAGRENRDGVVGTADSFEGSYTVAPDGALTLTLGDGTTLVGGLSRDGQFLAAAGGAAEGDAPHFLVAVAREYGVSR